MGSVLVQWQREQSASGQVILALWPLVVLENALPCTAVVQFPEGGQVVLAPGHSMNVPVTPGGGQLLRLAARWATGGGDLSDLEGLPIYAPPLGTGKGVFAAADEPSNAAFVLPPGLAMDLELPVGGAPDGRRLECFLLSEELAPAVPALRLRLTACAAIFNVLPVPVSFLVSGGAIG
jgi:hypothetical protein